MRTPAGAEVLLRNNVALRDISVSRYGDALIGDLHQGILVVCCENRVEGALKCLNSLGIAWGRECDTCRRSLFVFQAIQLFILIRAPGVSTVSRTRDHTGTTWFWSKRSLAARDPGNCVVWRFLTFPSLVLLFHLCSFATCCNSSSRGSCRCPCPSGNSRRGRGCQGSCSVSS